MIPDVTLLEFVTDKKEFYEKLHCHLLFDYEMQNKGFDRFLQRLGFSTKATRIKERALEISAILAILKTIEWEIQDEKRGYNNWK